MPFQQADYSDVEFQAACQEVLSNPERFLTHRLPAAFESLCSFPERRIDGTWKPFAALGCRACALAMQGHVADAMRRGAEWKMPTTVGTLTVTGFRGATLFIEATAALNAAGCGIEPMERKSLLPDGDNWGKRL